ncbi:uncharacterized protein [Leptinotarsa decemlineata]|uniref:uncharacterized protein n=1 Tax=Leptinotarsa decemlineata TaxID=7539 RepID=UPI003D3078F6
MMETPSIPLSLLRELRCRQCENFVSCGPVFVVPDGAVLCGRCRGLAKNVYRNTSYEALASMFRYPCKNWEDHCPRSLRWDESLEHEDYCSYHGGCNLFWKHPKAYWKGKRDIPLGDIRLIAIHEYLLDYITCVQCQSYLSCDPVYILSNGKNICHRCSYANGTPPNTIRNYLYETLSSIIIFPCVFRNRGCPTRLKFGVDLWQHESTCPYNQMFKKTEQKSPNHKERGVIKTHSGHYYGTITANTAPFSPPTPTSDFDMTKQLVKSLKKQQERRFMRAEEIQSSMGKNSEDGSDEEVESVKANSHGKHSSSGESVPTTPTRFENSSYLNKVSSPTPRDSGYFSQPSSNRTENYYQNISIAQVHRENNGSKQVSRSNSHSTNNSPTSKFFSRNEILPQNDLYNKPRSPKIEINGVPRSSATKFPFQNLDFGVLAGHYPVFGGQYENENFPGRGSVVPKPTFRDLVRSESLYDNRDLMAELKHRQNKLLKRYQSAPYEE